MSQFQPYIDFGWKLCKVNPGSKGPRTPGWNVAGAEATTFPPGHGAGLLHAFSGTMALDIDHYDTAKAWLDERGVDLDALLSADDAVQITSGKPQSAKLLYALPEPRIGAACAPYPGFNKNGEPITKLALDFRCASSTGNSQQDVLPPSIHPERAVPYEWIFGLCGHWRSLPTIPDALAALWDGLSAPLTENVSQVAIPSGAAPAKVEEWLKTQDPGMTRNDWVKVGMKLHGEFQGAMDGFAVWQRWSSGSVKWDEEARQNMLSIWKGFKLEGRRLVTLEADLRQMPASPEEFPDVPVEHTPVHRLEVPAPAASTDVETAYERQIRETMADYVVLQTGGSKPFFLLPDHPIASIRKDAGLAGVEVSREQLANILGPFLPPTLVGNRMVETDPCSVMRKASWRRKVHRVAFNPGGPETYDDGDGHAYLNAFKAIPIGPIKPLAHQIAPLEWLLRRILDDRNQPTGGVFASWLVRLYAFVLKNPGVKVKWAPLLYSAEQGTGKTTLMETLPALLFGRQYVKPMVHSVLRERFAGAKFDSTWWVCLQEMHSDAGKVDARSIANKLKPWITDDTIQIEKKGVDSYEIGNHLQFTACSNHDDALYIEEGNNDRRWLVGEMLGQAISTSEMAMLNPLLGGDFVRDPKAVNWLHWYFMHNVDTTGFSPAAPPPDTSAKQRVREQSRSVWEDEVYDAFETGRGAFDADIVQLSDITKDILLGKGVTNAQAKNLMRKIGGVERKLDDRRGVYVIRNHAQWNAQKAGMVKAYLRNKIRPFDVVNTPPVDDCDDLI